MCKLTVCVWVPCVFSPAPPTHEAWECHRGMLSGARHRRFFVGEASEEGGGCRGHAADWHCWTWVGVRHYVCAPLEGSRRKVPPSIRKDFVAELILGLAATALIATACIRKTMRNRVEPLLRPQTCVWTTSARRHENDEVSKLCEIPLAHGECLS